MIMDHGRRSWPEPQPDVVPLPRTPPYPGPADTVPVVIPANLPTAEEIKEFRDLLEQAKKIDKVTGQPDCEDPEKTIWLKGFCNRLREKSEEFAQMANELEAVLNET
jgi:hypothetical protein